MGRKILAVVVALIAAFAVIMIVDMINTVVVPMPLSNIADDPAKFKAYMLNMPTMAYVIVLVGYILASFIGGFIVTKMSRQVSTGPTMAVIIGAVLTVLGLSNFFLMLPGQPYWFIGLSLLSYIPISLLGYRFAR